MALTALGTAARRPLTRLEEVEDEEPNAVNVRSSSVELVEDYVPTNDVDDKDSAMDNNSEDDHLYSEEEIDLDDGPEPAASGLPRESELTMFEYPNDTLYYGDDSFIEAEEFPLRHGGAQKRQGQLPSSAPVSQPAMCPHSVALPELSDDEDDVSIDDHPSVCDARSRVAEYDKEQKAVAKKAACYRCPHVGMYFRIHYFRTP